MFNRDVKVLLQEAELVGTSSSNSHHLCHHLGKTLNWRSLLLCAGCNDNMSVYTNTQMGLDVS